MNLFYAEPGQIRPPIIELIGSEADHALKVMRYRKGDEIHITDGKGAHYTAVVSDSSKGRLVAEISHTQHEDKENSELIILIGLIRKRDRMEFAVEKCVELGANQIYIFRGDHSEKQKVRTDRIEATILSAMKQSLRFVKPGFKLFDSLAEAIADPSITGTLIVADETADQENEADPLNVTNEMNHILVVGPEGGFSEKERSLLKKAGAKTYSLGKKRLRTETAAAIMVDRFRKS
ncbi:MAG: RsmE family RNA methyltransferase [Balneolaceae bacterium]|nr:RsmE family RNA methyltransferase [Balneolaceae bacterium]